MRHSVTGVVVALCFQGCTSVGHIISYATTSPEKICRFTLTYAGEDTSGERYISFKSGFTGHDFVKHFHAVHHGARLAGKPIWSFRVPRPFHASEAAFIFPDFQQKQPCVAASDMVLTIRKGVSDNGRSISIPLKEVLPAPTWGEISLVVDDASARLALRENLGKIRYSDTAMENVWNLEPERVLYARDF